MSSRSTEVSPDRHASPSDARAPALPARLYGPRYWPTWLGLGLVRLIGALPYPVQMTLGAGLGRIAWCFARRDRHIANVNIGLCLPELDARARRRLVRRHFGALGCALLSLHGATLETQHEFKPSNASIAGVQRDCPWDVSCKGALSPDVSYVEIAAAADMCGRGSPPLSETFSRREIARFPGDPCRGRESNPHAPLGDTRF